MLNHSVIPQWQCISLWEAVFLHSSLYTKKRGLEKQEFLELFFTILIYIYLYSFWGSAVENSINSIKNCIGNVRLNSQCFNTWLPSAINVLTLLGSGN